MAMGQILSENNNSGRTNLDRKNPMLRSFVLDNIYAPIENCTNGNAIKNKKYSVNFDPSHTSMLASGSRTRPYSISGHLSKDRNAFSNDPISRYDDSSFPKSTSSKKKYEQDTL